MSCKDRCFSNTEYQNQKIFFCEIKKKINLTKNTFHIKYITNFARNYQEVN